MGATLPRRGRIGHAHRGLPGTLMALPLTLMGRAWWRPALG
jgi:hypothetical protein